MIPTIIATAMIGLTVIAFACCIVAADANARAEQNDSERQRTAKAPCFDHSETNCILCEVRGIGGGAESFSHNGGNSDARP